MTAAPVPERTDLVAHLIEGHDLKPWDILHGVQRQQEHHRKLHREPRKPVDHVHARTATVEFTASEAKIVTHALRLYREAEGQVNVDLLSEHHGEVVSTIIYALMKVEDASRALP